MDIYSDRSVMNSKEAIEWFRKEKQKVPLVFSTGIQALDVKLNGGFEAGQLVVIGAPPSSGKTHIGLKILSGIQNQKPGFESIVFSLESGNKHVIERLITHEAGRPYCYIPEEHKEKYEDVYADSNISICDRSDIGVEFIRSYCKRAMLRNKLAVVFVDYLDLIKKPSGPERTDEKLAWIANQLAAMAKDFNCLVILATQLSKEAIRRANRRPEMSDSKNSNGAAEAASYWIGLKRINRWDQGKIYPDSELVELVIDKVRGIGETGVVWLRQFNEAYFEIDQKHAENLIERSNEERKQNADPKKLIREDIKNMFTTRSYND